MSMPQHARVSELHGPGTQETQTRRELAAAFRWAYRLGFHEAIANHFSAVVGEHFLINPYGTHFARMRASDLLLMSFDGAVRRGEGRPDDTAWHIHSRIHARVARARCVLHTHMPYATALACTEGFRLQPIDQNAMRFYERIAYDDDFGGMALDDAEGDRLCTALGEHNILLLANHGVIVVAESIAQAFDELYYLERACQIQWLALSTGRPPKPVESAIAAKTRDQWLDSKEHSALHFAELMRILDEEEPEYAE
jgi:ribulose-5-phosphate 4-epimerase/fuculose-1-phosphate aldolase